MRQMVIIALNTFRENLRDKILYNLLFFSIFLMGASVMLADLTIMEHHKIITDMGLASINLVGVIIAIFVGISLVSKEIDRRTIYTIMVRPISRAQFILGKYLGLIVTLFVNLVVMVVMFLATMLFYHVPIHLALFQAIELIFIELLLVTAMALFFSTFSSSILSAIMTIGLYIVGHLTTDMMGIARKSQSEAIKALMIGLYYACPNLGWFNIKGQAAMGILVPASYQTLVTAYGVLYTAILVMAACAVFRRREF